MRKSKSKGAFYSVVIPCYNIGESLLTLVARLEKVFIKLQLHYEIILVDDCSPQAKTWQIITNISNKYPNVRGVQLTRNFGQHRAILCGIKLSKGDYIITMDDDGQHRPEDIPIFMKQNSHDIVLGKFTQKHHGVIKKMLSTLFEIAVGKLLNRPKGTKSSPFRMIKKPIAKAALKFATPFPYLDALLYYVTQDVVNVEVEHAVRAEGKSNYTLRRQLRLFFNMLFNNTAFLLRLTGYIGFSVAFLSFFYGMLLIVNKILGAPVTGWTSLMTGVMFFGGMTLLSLGVMGEYIWRIICVSEKKPTYIIRQQTKN